jgi:hypothetical protein
MANKVYWTDGSSYWDIGGNWSTGAIPGTTDVAVLGGQSVAYEVSLIMGLSPVIGGLEIGGSSSLTTLNLGDDANLTVFGNVDLLSNSKIIHSAGNSPNTPSVLSAVSLVDDTGGSPSQIVAQGYQPSSEFPPRTLDLEIISPINVGSSVSFQINNGGQLELGGNTQVTSGTFAFDGSASGDLELGNPQDFHGIISGLNIDLSFNPFDTNFIYLPNVDPANPVYTFLIKEPTLFPLDNSNTLFVTWGTEEATFVLENIQAPDGFRGPYQGYTNRDPRGGTDVYLVQGICYAAGTLIATPRGEVAVQHLAVGDTVLTVSGAVQSIVWIGTG